MLSLIFLVYCITCAGSAFTTVEIGIIAGVVVAVFVALVMVPCCIFSCFVLCQK